MSPETLLDNAANGDERAIEEIYSSYSQKVYYFIRRYVKDENDAEDVLQDTFISVIKSANTFNRQSKFETWLLGVARNNALMHLRKNKEKFNIVDNEDMLGTVEDDDAEFLPGEVLENNETARYIASLVDNLPLEQKNVVLLYYYQQMKVSEISDELGVSENTVKSRLNYARRYIKQDVEEKTNKGYKVIAVTPLPLLTAIMRMMEKEEILSADASARVLSGVMSGTAGTAGAGATSSAAASGTSGIAGISSAAVKIAIGVIGAAAVVGVAVFTNMNKQTAEVAREEPVAIVETIAAEEPALATEEPDASVAVIAVAETLSEETEETEEFEIPDPPVTKSDYAKFYYKYIQEHLKDDARFLDAEIGDFYNTGEYGLFVVYDDGGGVGYNYYPYRSIKYLVDENVAFEQYFFDRLNDDSFDMYYLIEYDGRYAVAWLKDWVSDSGHMINFMVFPIFEDDNDGYYVQYNYNVDGGSGACFRTMYSSMQPEMINDYVMEDEVMSIYNGAVSTCGIGDDFELTRGERLRDYFE